MFDANGSDIEIGVKFFVQVDRVNHQLEQLGIKQGDIVLCQHVEKTTDFLRENVHSLLWTSKEAEPVSYYDAKTLDTDWSLLVYAGVPSGAGFIDDEVRASALAFLGGEWNVD